MGSSKIKKISLFDFDDTIATAPGKIAISSKLGDDFVLSFLKKNKIQFEKFCHSKSGDIVFYLDSHNFKNYKNAVNGCNKTKRNQILDFSSIAGFEPKHAIPILEPFNKMCKSYRELNTLTGIITARTGVGTEKSILGSGVNVPITNATDIQKFLSFSGGIYLPVGDPPIGRISTIGDIGGRPIDKAKIIEKYIENYEPSIVEFHDDDSENIKAIKRIIKKYPGVEFRLYLVLRGRLFRN